MNRVPWNSSRKELALWKMVVVANSGEALSSSLSRSIHSFFRIVSGLPFPNQLIQKEHPHQKRKKKLYEYLLIL
uniref:Uncharacterized protein n=1 Tax=Nelumbo nucifera TaxID=4432 RepID=A0A822XWN3_NELNU|nr:TPA_asm: hypothetical protein HUJ06_027522 [Nelumbo nucifera]